MQYSAFVLQKATWINLSYSMSTLGSRKERTGQGEKHATYRVLFESSMRNTGDSSVDAKSSGEGARGKRLTKARCHIGESDGAS